MPLAPLTRDAGAHPRPSAGAGADPRRYLPDLQTPITRMKLRVEMADQPELRDKLLQDLVIMMTRLVREGIASPAPRSHWRRRASG